MSELEKQAEEHVQRAEWPKAAECFSKLLGFQKTKNGFASKEKIILLLLGRGECFLAMRRYEQAYRDGEEASALSRRDEEEEQEEEIETKEYRRSMRLMLESSFKLERYREAASLVEEWLVFGNPHGSTRRILWNLENLLGKERQTNFELVADENLKELENNLNEITRLTALYADSLVDIVNPNGRKPKISDELLCTYCSLRFPDSAALVAHFSTESHQIVIMSDEGREWHYRPPPRGLTADAYAICEGYQERNGICRYGERCVDAHGQAELDEWRERFEYRRMKLQQASETQLTYTEMLLEKWLSASNPEEVMRERIDGIEESISGELVTSVSSKNSQREWTFLFKAHSKLKAVALVQDAHRNHFSLKEVSFNHAKSNKKPETWKPSNDQEWTNGPASAEPTVMNGDSHGGPMFEHRVRVAFKTDIYGTFRQSVVFDFGTEPVLVKHICVDVVPVSDVDKMKEIKKEVTLSSGERWCAENAEIVPFTSSIAPVPATSIFDVDKEQRLLETYPTPRTDSFTLTQSTVVEKCVTKENYRDRMHELLYVEEMARYEQVARYNVTTRLQIANCYLLSPNGMANSTAKYAHNGELFALMHLGKDVSEDTSAGRLILNNCSAVFISAMQTKDKREGCRRIAYEALIEDKGKKVIYLRLSAVAVAALGLRPDSEIACQIQFQLNRIPYCEWHYAIDKIVDYKVIFPDTVLEPKIPWSPQRQWNDVLDTRLNAKQREAIVAITSPALTPLPPVLIIGPFGTGKTYTLAQAIKQIIMQPDSRILVCTHSNSAADLYIKDYLHPWVEAGNENARPLRIYYHKRWVATVSQDVLKYCLVDIVNGARAFKIPSLEDILKHRIVVVTLSISMYLSEMGLKKGHFTHILLDEAAQAMECEAIMPLALANERTRIVLAGDHMQLSPELFSQFAKDRNLHVSLLERLYDHYPNDFPCKILLCENYRAHEAIINFTSELFYDQKLISSGKQPRHEKFYPLTFFTTRGEDVQDINSTAFYNCSEVYEVVERVCELRKKWPASWGKLEDQSIGIMTPYSDQVFRIRAELRKRRMGSIPVERVLNVQGKQFRAIFLSTVRTRRTCMGSAQKPANEMNFGFLSNWKLLNTAITRAQSLVAVVGDPVALCSIGRCRKVWERFIEICNDHKSLFGITWSGLRTQLDGVELKKVYALNPLAPEFIPRALQNESYIKIPAMVPGYRPGLPPFVTPVNYPMLYYPSHGQVPPQPLLPPLRPAAAPLPFRHLGAPGPWPPFATPLSPKNEEPKNLLPMGLLERRSPNFLEMSSLLPNLDLIDLVPQHGYLLPVMPERHMAPHLSIAPLVRPLVEKPDHIQFLNNVHFPERIPVRQAPPQLGPSDWQLLLPPNTSLREVLDSRDLQMSWYRYLATSVSLDIAEKFKNLVLLASEKPKSPSPERPLIDIIEAVPELTLDPKPLMLRDLEAAMMNQMTIPNLPSPVPLNMAQSLPPAAQLNLPPTNVPPPNMHPMTVPPPPLPLYRRSNMPEEPMMNGLGHKEMYSQPPPGPSGQPNSFLNDFHLNGREQDIEEPSPGRQNVETTYASVLRSQHNRGANGDASDPLGILKSLAKSGTSQGRNGFYQYFS